MDAATRRAAQWGWLLVFAANLPLPLMLGSWATKHGGTNGMCAALPVLWLCGHVTVGRVPKLRAPLVIGSAIVAPMQLLGIFHLFAGVLALRFVGALDPESGAGLSEVQAFFATVFVAVPMAFVALLQGGAVTWIVAQLRGTDPQ